MVAPEPTQNIVSAKPGQEEEEFLSMTQDRAEALDHNARLYFEIDPEGHGTNLYSFYCEYQDYLDDRNLVDVSTICHKISNSP